MKKIFSIFVIFSLILSMSLTAAATTTITIKVNNKAVDFKGFAPYKAINGIMVSLSEAAKAAGATVEYIKNTNEAKVTSGDTCIIFQAGRTVAIINGQSYKMVQAAAGKNGKIYVPAKFLYEKMGGTVTVNKKSTLVTVTIKKPAAAASTPSAQASSGLNVAMPASKDFKPYSVELAPIDAQVLKELQAYKDDKDGKLKWVTKDGKGMNCYMPNADAIKSIGLSDAKEMCIFAKSMMEVENNVDYRTIGSNFIQQYRYFFMPESGGSWKVNGISYTIENYIGLRYNDVKKYKIVEKAEFLTDTSLIYNNKNDEMRLRGRLKFMFESVDPEYFNAYGLPKYELNKWYNSDVEVREVISFTRNGNKWPHSYYTYGDRVYINKNILMK